MVAALDAAQATPEGRARIALIAALYQEPEWVPGQPEPAPDDIEAQQAGQYQNLRTILPFIVFGRYDMEQSAGGNPTWNKGVDYRRQLAESGQLAQVGQLYRRAGIDLHADLRLLTRTATVTADPAAHRWMSRTSTLSGRLDMPVLTLHTTDDGLVPVQHEQEYAEDVRRSGAGPLLRQAYVAHAGHCTFTTAELVAAVLTIETRVRTGHWGELTQPGRMQSLADSLGLDSGAFVKFRPDEFLGDRTHLPASRAGGRSDSTLADDK
jgi:pimeloyl-ACP methyl ester carboxylesterase